MRLPVTVIASRSSSGSSCFNMPRAPPASSNSSMRTLAIGADGGEHGHLPADLVPQPEDIEVHAALDRDGLQMLDRIDRAGDGEDHGDRIAEGAGRHDLARGSGPPAPSRRCAGRIRARESNILRLVGAHRPGAGQRHADRFDHAVHRIGGRHAGADAGPRTAWRIISSLSCGSGLPKRVPIVPDQRSSRSTCSPSIMPEA